MKVMCDYCGNQAHIHTGAYVYPHRQDLAGKLFYVCWPCEAWVGVHEGSATPLGRLANAELRKAKQMAHAAFDPLWKSRRMSRTSAYKWLATAMKLTPDECHIGMFDAAQCKRVVEVVSSRQY